MTRLLTTKKRLQKNDKKGLSVERELFLLKCIRDELLTVTENA